LDREHADSSDTVTINPAEHRCIHCGYYSVLDDDGWCSDCAGEQESEDELQARTKRAARMGHRNAARVLHRMADQNSDPTFAAVLRARARVHEKDAER
jgi:hypothetical protein